MEQPVEQKRQLLFIDKRFQTRFSLSWIALSYLLGLVMAILGSVGTYLYRDLIQSGKLDASQGLTHAVLAFVACNVVFVFWLMIAVIILSILHSHRVAGAIYRMSTGVDKVMDGDLDHSIDLRPKDHFKDLATKLNSLIASLRENCHARENLAGLNRNILQKLDGQVDLNEEISAFLKQAKQELKVIQATSL